MTDLKTIWKVMEKKLHYHTGCFFLHFWEHMLRKGVENGSKLKIYSFFEMLEDFGCKFEGSKIVKKSKLKKRLHKKFLMS